MVLSARDLHPGEGCDEMRRLIERRRDRGAVAVFVALMMVVVLGFTALGVDAGAMWSDQKQLQNGADAAALAIAQACADGDCTAYATDVTATQYAQSNKFDGNATGHITDLNTAQSYVTVMTSSTRSLWFARVFDINSANIATNATAAWGVKSSGSFLPLAFSLCSFWAQSGIILGDPIPPGTPMTLYLKSKSDITGAITSDPSGQCLPNTDAAHNEVDGGFGWLAPTSTSPCSATVSVGNWVQSSPGSSPPCNIGTSLQNAIVQIPVFDQCLQSTNGCVGGNNAQYHIYAIASFQVTGYCFSPNTAEWNVTSCDSAHARIVGTFVDWTSADSTTTIPGAPNLGAGQVALTH